MTLDEKRRPLTVGLRVSSRQFCCVLFFSRFVGLVVWLLHVHAVQSKSGALLRRCLTD
jgi:hypothetical protein